MANKKHRAKTYVQLIPAVKEASSEFSAPKSSPVLALLANITRQAFENKKEVQDFITQTQNTFQEMTDPENVPQLKGISGELTRIVQQYYSDAELAAGWAEVAPIQLSYPTPELSVRHRNLDVNAASVGHGLQRVLVLTVVQYLAESQSLNEFDQPEAEFSEAMSDIILLIEEPEIYQHPIKQKVIYDAISQLCTAFNKQTGIRMQVVFTTHSEKMIEMGAFHSLRIIRKVSENGSFRTECSSCKILKCSEQLAALLDPPKPPMSDEAFAAKLHIFSREVSEGFFSDKVILVEGGTDKAILEGAFRSRDRDAPSEGLSIICIDGKTKLDKPFLIFGNLGIPAYMVFDNDEGDKKDIQKKIATNILLQKVCGVEEPMEFPVGVNELFAAFDGDLESYLRTVVGDDFSPLLEQIATQWGLSQKEISKTPVAMSSFFFLAGQKGYQFELLDAIIDKVDRLT